MAQNEDARSSDVWDEQSWINGGQSGVQYRVSASLTCLCMRCAWVVWRNEIDGHRGHTSHFYENICHCVLLCLCYVFELCDGT